MADIKYRFVVPPLFTPCLGIILGILWGYLSPVSFLWAPVFAAGAFLFFILYIKGIPRRMGGPFVLCLALWSWGAFGSHGIHHKPALDLSMGKNRSPVEITGEVVSFLRHYPGKTRLVLSCQTASPKGGVPRPLDGKIYLNIKGLPEKESWYGRRIKVLGRFYPPRNFGNPGAFDYITHLKREQIHGSIYAKPSGISILSHGQGMRVHLGRWVENARNDFYFFLQDRLGKTDAAHVMGALITGKKHGIPLELRDLFSRSGASHLLAVSGLHMAIWAFIFYRILYIILMGFHSLAISGWARKLSGLFSLFPLFCIAVFSGFSPATQRAFIMVSTFILAFCAEEDADPLNSLCLAGIIILCVDVTSLFSISFQLSFTALVFLITIGQLVRSLPQPENRLLSWGLGLALVSLVAGVATAPLIAHYFNMVSWIQIPVNLALVPLLGMICLPLGVVCFFLYTLSFPWAGWGLDLCGALVDLSIGYMEFWVGLPGVWAMVPGPSILVLCFLYIGLGLLSLSLYRGRHWKFSAVCSGLCLIFAGVIYSLPTRLPTGVEINVLDVGQGNSCFIQTEKNHRILVDGGGFAYGSGFDTGRHILAPFLWQRKITDLDAVILTHPESDHMNGLIYILEHFDVGQVIKNEDTRETRSYCRFMAICNEKNIPIVHPNCSQDRWVFDDVLLSFFQCDRLLEKNNFNNNSLVFKLSHGDVSMLFPGDILKEREALLAMNSQDDLRAKVLLAPHHGSQSSSRDFFLDKVAPESIIISCGHLNRYRFPNSSVLERYRHRNIRILRTDLHGAVTIRSNGKQYNFITQKSE